jgi:hypothetical protein
MVWKVWTGREHQICQLTPGDIQHLKKRQRFKSRAFHDKCRPSMTLKEKKKKNKTVVELDSRNFDKLSRTTTSERLTRRRRCCSQAVILTWTEVSKIQRRSWSSSIFHWLGLTGDAFTIWFWINEELDSRWSDARSPVYVRGTIQTTKIL